MTTATRSSACPLDGIRLFSIGLSIAIISLCAVMMRVYVIPGTIEFTYSDFDVPVWKKIQFLSIPLVGYCAISLFLCAITEIIKPLKPFKGGGLLDGCLHMFAYGIGLGIIGGAILHFSDKTDRQIDLLPAVVLGLFICLAICLIPAIISGLKDEFAQDV